MTRALAIVALAAAASSALASPARLITAPPVIKTGNPLTGPAFDPLAAQGQSSQAIARYESALKLLPNARSATTLLSALYISIGRLEDAERLAGAFLGSHAAADDPLPRYLLGDYRNYPALIAQLREAIR